MVLDKTTMTAPERIQEANQTMRGRMIVMRERTMKEQIPLRLK